MANSISTSDNIIFNNFLTAKLKYNIDLTLANTYKACLLKTSFYNLYSKSDFINTISNYSFISSAGFECEDSNKNYVTGGSFIKFDMVEEETDYSIIQKFTLNEKFRNLIWKDVKFKNSQDPLKYLLFYRVDDGLLLACFGLDYEEVSDSEVDINITWGSNPVFSIDYTKFSGMSIDNEFKLGSTNPIQNDVITKGLIKYGILLENENSENPDLPNEYETVSETEKSESSAETTQLDKMTIIKDVDSLVDNIFGEDISSDTDNTGE